MQDVLTMIANFGFPIVVAVYLLVRIESRLEKLTVAITDLAKVVGEMKASTSIASESSTAGLLPHGTFAEP
jgi:hypothetical protein